MAYLYFGCQVCRVSFIWFLRLESMSGQAVGAAGGVFGIPCYCWFSDGDIVLFWFF